MILLDIVIHFVGQTVLRIRNFWPKGAHRTLRKTKNGRALRYNLWIQGTLARMDGAVVDSKRCEEGGRAKGTRENELVEREISSAM